MWLVSTFEIFTPQGYDSSKVKLTLREYGNLFFYPKNYNHTWNCKKALFNNPVFKESREKANIKESFFITAMADQFAPNFNNLLCNELNDWFNILNWWLVRWEPNKCSVFWFALSIFRLYRAMKSSPILKSACSVNLLHCGVIQETNFKYLLNYGIYWWKIMICKWNFCYQ